MKDIKEIFNFRLFIEDDNGLPHYFEMDTSVENVFIRTNEDSPHAYLHIEDMVMGEEFFNLMMNGHLRNKNIRIDGYVTAKDTGTSLDYSIRLKINKSILDTFVYTGKPEYFINPELIFEVPHKDDNGEKNMTYEIKR